MRRTVRPRSGDAGGAAPVSPPIPGLADAGYWTNRDAIEAVNPPSSLVVLGGGAIGLELAQAFARFGSVVTVVEGADRVLTAEEPEASAVIAEVLAAEGLTLRTGRRASRGARPGRSGVSAVPAGLEIDVHRLRGRPLILALTGFVVSFAFAFAFAFAVGVAVGVALLLAAGGSAR